MLPVFRMSCALLACGLLSWTWQVQAQSKETKEKVCKALFKQKRLLEAAQCFAALAESFDSAALKDANNRYQKGRWLRNATILMTRVARAEKDIAKKSYYFEQARAYVVPYLQEKLYETKHQKRLATVRIAGLEAKIGYALLSIATRHLKAQIQLEGFKFKADGVGAWSKKVRPGNYVVRVTYPGSPVEIKAVKVEAGQPKIVQFSPPAAAVASRRPLPTRRVEPNVTTRKIGNTPAPQGKPTWPWILVIGGGTVAVVGAVFLGIGGGNYGAANAMRERGLSQALREGDDVNAYNALHDQVGWQVPLGGILAGVGGVTLIAGLIAYAAVPGAKRTTSASLPVPHSRAFASFAFFE